MTLRRVGLAVEMAMTDSGMSIKDYIDALNAERRHTANMRALAIVGTVGAMIFGVLQATKVLAETFEKRMDTTNEWRGALEDQAKGKATVEELQHIKAQLEEVRTEQAAERNRRGGSAGNWKQIGAVIAAIAAINGMIFLFDKEAEQRAEPISASTPQVVIPLPPAQVDRTPR